MKAICGLKCISGLSFQQMTTQMQQDCSARTSTRHSPRNALQAHGLQTPSDVIPAFARHSSGKDDRLRRPKYPERRNAGHWPAFTEQRIAGLRPARPRGTQSRHSSGTPRAKTTDFGGLNTPSDAIHAGLRPALPMQRNCSSYGCSGSASGSACSG